MAEPEKQTSLKVKLESLDLAEEKREQLKELFPEAFAEDKVDFDQLKRALGEWVEPAKERFGLNWPGKAECMKIIQQPSVATLKPARDESVNFDETENLFIEGDNLEVLKLLQKSYFGEIKMIFIDPPYNTGNEFIYPDKFSETLETYLEYTGQKDTDGKKFSTNTDAAGRYHSRWLNMMYPRLYLAKNLLRNNGCIFISIDDNEISHLRKLCDEIFGEENFVAQVEWQKRYTRSNNTDNFTSVIDHIVIYQKSSDFKVNLLERDEEANARFTNPDNDPRGAWKATPFLNQVPPEKRPNLCYPIKNPHTGTVENPTTKAWRYEQKVFEKLLEEDRLWWGVNKDKKVPDIKTFLSEVRQGMTPINFWDYKYAGHTDEANREIKDIFGEKIFDTPKPTLLIKRMIEHACSKDDLIMDFFAGSSATAHGVMLKNKEDGGSRKFIMVQLPENLQENSSAYSEGYKTIADIGKERIRRAGKKIEEEQNGQLDFNGEGKLDLGFKVFKLDKSNFKVWEGDVEKVENLEQQLFDHVDHINDASAPEDILYELLLKSGFTLSTQVEKLQLAGKDVFSVAEGALLICLDKNLTQEVIDAIADADPLQVICLDDGFEGNDQLKANAVQTFKARAQEDKDHEIVFRTV